MSDDWPLVGDCGDLLRAGYRLDQWTNAAIQYALDILCPLFGVPPIVWEGVRS